MKAARLFLITAILLAAAGAARAQFGLGDLNKALDKAKQVKEKAEEVSKVSKAGGNFTLAEEQLIGDSVALEIVARFGGLWRDEEATRRVTLVGSALARYGDRPALEWRFGVLDSDAVNAFSAPGGYVFITRGLYLSAPTDDLLAGILAHEIAHITEKHALKIIGRSEAISVAGKYASQYSGDVQKAESSLAETRAKAGEVSPELAQYLDLNIGKIVNLLLEKGFDPRTEYGADRLGRNLAATNGYAPGGLRAVLTGLQDKKVEPKQMFSTHPSLRNRLKELPNDPPPPTAPAAGA